MSFAPRSRLSGRVPRRERFTVQRSRHRVMSSTGGPTEGTVTLESPNGV